MNLALEYRDVTVRYAPGLQPVMQAVSFSIDEGERVALLGLNGSGKTSLLLATVGLLPSSGDIIVCGTRLESKCLSNIRSKIGFLFSVPEDQLLFPNVLDDVAFGAIRSGMAEGEARDRAQSIMRQLGIADLADIPLHQLSHGQKQRVALAGTLITNPPLLLLDEPSTSLDPPAKHQLAQYLASLPSALLVATHDLEFAARICHRYVLLEGGQIKSQGADVREVEGYWACKTSADLV